MIFSTNKYIKILSEIDNLLQMLGLHVLRKACVLLESDSGITDTTLQHKIITLSLYSCSLELEVVLVFNTL